MRRDIRIDKPPNLVLESFVSLSYSELCHSRVILDRALLCPFCPSTTVV
jgi:hypothetical protein